MKELKLRQRQLTEINGRIDEKQEETDAVELQQNRLNHERRILEGRLPKLPPCKVKSKVSAARYSTRCSDS